MISRRYRCIYVNAPKCASTALRDRSLEHGPMTAPWSFRPRPAAKGETG